MSTETNDTPKVRHISSVEHDLEKKRTVLRKQSLWRNRDFLFLWSGQAISLIGTSSSQLAFPLLILALTGSPAQAGFIGALGILPFLLLSLPAGALIDRWNRKRTMIICDVGRTLSMASIPFALVIGHLIVIQLYLTSIITGTFFVFFNIAEVACLPRVVSKEQLPDAAARNEATMNVSFLLGPLLGGSLYGIGRALPFLADAISYVISVISLLFIKTKFEQERIVTRCNLRTEILE